MTAAAVVELLAALEVVGAAQIVAEASMPTHSRIGEVASVDIAIAVEVATNTQ